MPQTITTGYKELCEAAEREIETLPVAEAVKLAGRDDTVLVDIRDIRELQREGRVPGAFHCPRGMLEFWIDPNGSYFKPVFGQDKKFVFFCAGGMRSALAAQTAQRIAERLHFACRETARQRRIPLSLTANSDPDTARRFASLDLAGHPRAAATAHFDPATQAAEYTPGAALPAASWNAFERVRAEGAVHVWLDGGAISRLPLPGGNASERSVADFVAKAYNETNCRGLRFIVG